MQVGDWLSMQVGDWLSMQVCDWLSKQVCDWLSMQVCDWLSMQVCDWLSMQVGDWLSKSAVVVTTTLPTGTSPPCRGIWRDERYLETWLLCFNISGKHLHALVSQGQIRVRIRG